MWAIPRSKGQEFTTIKLPQVERSLQVPMSHSWMESCLCCSHPLLSGGHSSAPAHREQLGVYDEAPVMGMKYSNDSTTEGSMSQEEHLPWFLWLWVTSVQKFPNFLLSLFFSLLMWFKHFWDFASAPCHSPMEPGTSALRQKGIWDWFYSWILSGIQDIPVTYTNNNFEKIVQGIVFFKFLRQPLFAEQLLFKWLL